MFNVISVIGREGTRSATKAGVTWRLVNDGRRVGELYGYSEAGDGISLKAGVRGEGEGVGVGMSAIGDRKPRKSLPPSSDVGEAGGEDVGSDSCRLGKRRFMTLVCPSSQVNNSLSSASESFLFKNARFWRPNAVWCRKIAKSNVGRVNDVNWCMFWRAIVNVAVDLDSMDIRASPSG
jgi:hypothetical protein